MHTHMDNTWIIGCEESQAITIEMRKRGIKAFSCDLKPASGGHPEWHICGDIFEAVKALKPTHGIIHPPCTYLTVTANKWLKDQPLRISGALVGEARREARREAIAFFMALWNLDIEHLCLENPVGCMSTEFRPADQIIHPYMFGDEAMKATCLWLRGLPKLIHQKIPDLFSSDVTHVDKGERIFFDNGKSMPKWYAFADKSKGQAARAEIRSKTFPGIATAMAEQWGNY